MVKLARIFEHGVVAKQADIVYDAPYLFLDLRGLIKPRLYIFSSCFVEIDLIIFIQTPALGR